MEVVKKLYLQIYFFVMALYVFFNKGIAYSFLAEAMWAIGFIVLFLTRKKYAFGWDKRTKILAFFLAIIVGYIGWGIRTYELFDVIRDSFIIQYAWFAFFVFLFKDLRKEMWSYIIRIYTWFPFFALLNFYIQNFTDFSEDFVLFGTVPFSLYKYGDMGVHLLISSLVLMLYLNQRSIRFQITLAVAILMNLLIITAYSRSGMLAYLIGIGLFVVYTKRQEMRDLIKQYLRYLPIILLIVLPLYASIKVKENFQGRKVGMGQLIENVTSIFGSGSDVTLENNKIWRLVWWANILDYSTSPEFALQGKGLGMSLAESDIISTDSEDLRSPHNFNLTILARFGWPLFLLWSYWLFCLFKPMFQRKLTDQQLMISCVLFTFWLNGSFDVFLEGPMGAFPFWTWVGLYLLGDFFPEVLLAPNISTRSGRP
ncbi:O-antigen ligase family protein [Aquirufa antheringensis]|uniref:O-antigen ligase family protein n=1 Tax=Aquirufa antheringensis TaxID=2516559 RepID=UPI0022A9D255|nr:O-antigen ligase family protein [Aquirufa antheringensis]MCZ2484707.1 O-antigen ligase family protein [Aquirufa antheringensis]